MSDTEAEDSKSESKNVPMRWRVEEWELLERAAVAFGVLEHMPRTTPTAIIRSGALRRAEEILEEAGGTGERRDGVPDRRSA
jgi:hypothetical protein